MNSFSSRTPDDDRSWTRGDPLVRAQRYIAEPAVGVDGMTRQQCCERYAGKVLLLARRVHERLSRDTSTQLEDLVSCGALGLLEAYDRFDPTRGIQFSTFAEYRIRGAMYDQLRGNDTHTRRRRHLARRVAGAVDELRSTLGREPAPEEVAARLDIDVAAYFEAVDKSKPVSHLSLDGDTDEGHPLIERLMSGGAAPDAGIAARELRKALEEAVAGLPERQKQAVYLYYGQGLTLAEIAEVFEVTVSRVSQILTEARGRLRKRLEPLVDPSDLGDGVGSP